MELIYQIAIRRFELLNDLRSIDRGIQPKLRRCSSSKSLPTNQAYPSQDS